MFIKLTLSRIGSQVKSPVIINVYDILYVREETEGSGKIRVVATKATRFYVEEEINDIYKSMLHAAKFPGFHP